MNRSTTLALLRVAGYHNDAKTWTRVYVEGRVSRPAASVEWQRGRDMKAAGMSCSCRDCNPVRSAP